MKELFEDILKLSNPPADSNFKSRAEKALQGIETLFLIKEVPEEGRANQSDMNIEVSTKKLF